MGEALTILPPTVARLRTWAAAIRRRCPARAGRAAPSRGESINSATVVAAPMNYAVGARPDPRITFLARKEQQLFFGQSIALLHVQVGASGHDQCRFCRSCRGFLFGRGQFFQPPVRCRKNSREGLQVRSSPAKRSGAIRSRGPISRSRRSIARLSET